MLVFRNVRVRAVIVAMVLCLALISGGCGNHGPARAAVQGRVTVAGTPLKAGRVLFLPLPPNQGPAASAGIFEGEYRLPADEGPVVGENRVKIEAELPLGFPLDDEAAYAKRGGKPLPPQPIPAQYNRESKLVFHVKLNEENKFDVDIPKHK